MIEASALGIPNKRGETTSGDILATARRAGHFFRLAALSVAYLERTKLRFFMPC